MRTNKAPVFLLYVAAEVTLFYLFWKAFGSVAAISLLLLGFLLGLLVMRMAGRHAFRALTDAERRSAAFGVQAPDGSPQVVHGAAHGRPICSGPRAIWAVPPCCSSRGSCWHRPASSPTSPAWSCCSPASGPAQPGGWDDGSRRGAGAGRPSPS